MRSRMELRVGVERRERVSSALLRGVESVECFIVVNSLLLDKLGEREAADGRG